MNDFQRKASSPIPSAPPEPPPLASFSANLRPPQTAAANYYPSSSMLGLKPHHPIPWSTGLCDCCNDISICCLTCWCPCITFGRIAEIVDRGSTPCGVSGTLYMLIMGVIGCSCVYSCFYRSKLRGQFSLEESPCADCCVHCFCEGCALCQEYRELQHQGFDMSFGWHGNVERQKRIAALNAPNIRGMTR